MSYASCVVRTINSQGRGEITRCAADITGVGPHELLEVGDDLEALVRIPIGTSYLVRVRVVVPHL